MLELVGVTVSYRQQGRQLCALRQLSLQLRSGELYGLVGESGSGKSTLALAALRALPASARVTGTVRIAGEMVYRLAPKALRQLWRQRVKYVPQNPLPALNPSRRVGWQLAEAIDPLRPRRVSRQRLAEALAQVGLEPERVARSYPHELSGGMQQRLMIAMALAGEPELLILDEPTTNLDVTTEATILELLRSLVARRQTAVLYISHNLGVIAQLCDRVGVLYAGELVEEAPTAALYRAPYHPYTRVLLRSLPQLGAAQRLQPIPGRAQLGALPEGCSFAARCPVALPACRSGQVPLVPFDETSGRRYSRCLRAAELAGGALKLPQLNAAVLRPERQGELVLRATNLSKRYALPRRRQLQAVEGVSLALRRGQTLGLVGESGSGKSTLARLIVGLEVADGGKLELFGQPLPLKLAARDRQALRRLQMVFQSSEMALNPHRTVGDILRRPLRRLQGMSRAEAAVAARELLEAVKLDTAYLERLPGELSGGERQRVAIARAFAAAPELLILDESVSGLDVSVQAAILNLLAELQKQRGTSYLFVSHDLAAVSYLADTVAVMYLGRLMELTSSAALLSPPHHPYTEALLAALPRAQPGWRPPLRLAGEPPNPTERPRGCPFASRCPRVLGELCYSRPPPAQVTADGGRIDCHIPLDELAALQAPVLGVPDAELPA